MKVQQIISDLFDPGSNLYLIHPIVAFLLGSLATEDGNNLMTGMFLTIFALTIVPVPNARRKKKLAKLGSLPPDRSAEQQEAPSEDNENE